MMCVCAIPTAGNAFTLTIAGKANFMDSETAQSPKDSWNENFVSQTISGDSGDFYFWATGDFKLSHADPAPTNWDEFYKKNNVNVAFQITENSIDWTGSNVSNLGTDRKFIHLHIELNKNKVEVQDEPFAGHEGVWASAFENGETIYYFPNENFKSSDAIFRAVFNDGTTVLCHNYEFDPDYYTFTVPKEGLTAVKIQRGKADLSGWWDNFTAELKSKDKGSNNCITMESNNGNNWESAPSSWTYYEPLTEPATYTYYFCSRSNDSEEWQLQPLMPEYGKCSFTRSDLSGKQFAIRVDVNDKQRYWFIPATDIEFTTTKSYSLTSAATNGSRTFPSDAPASEYTFVIEFKDNKPSRLRVNSPAAAYNKTLFVGIASSNRHQIQYKEDTNTYEEYKFYVNQEDLDNDGEFGFRFYSEPNGGVWMGNNDFGKVFGTDISFNTEITTSGIKRYFLKETGAYAINVKSYDPEKGIVVFTLTKLDTDVVLPKLYIGGTWNNGLVNETEKLQIPSSHGKYQPVKITVEDNCAFRFYSEKTNGNWMGPVYTDGINVDAEGTLPYTTVGNGNTFKLAEAGTYTIKVSEYLADNNKVTFTVTKEADPSFTVPTTLYLRNSRNWDDTPIAMTRQDGAGDNDRNTCKFFAEVDYNANEDFQFNFIEKYESNWPDRGIVCYPSTNELSVSANTPARIDNVGTCTDNPDKAWSYNSTEGGKITVSVYFKKNGYATVEVVGNSDKNYYFIGDMNNWFSNEFDGNLGDTDKNGQKIEKGINKTRWEADKDNWKFEYMGDGWYRFNSFPGGLLSGHFQIVSGGSWEIANNDIFSHVICVQEDDVKANKLSDYRAFKMNRITRDDIRNGREYRVRKRDESQTNGSNLGTQCNAVEGAEFWFNPGNDTEAPRIRIKGTPKDYFIFYNMEKAGEGVFDPDKKISLNEQGTDEYWVRAAINSGKPNTNNYFLAGIEYGDYTLPFYDINGNTGAHMNVNEGIDLAPYDLKNMTERELNNLFFNNSDIVNSILNEDKLPNGRDISVYDKVWIAKIPSGFENPAGTKYNMTFNKAMTEADRNATRTLTTCHYYFFPQERGLHVHVNIDEILAGDKVESAEVAYRLYKTDNYYNTIAIHHGSDDERGRWTETLHEVGSALPLTEESESKAIGWYPCEKHDKSEWVDPSDTDTNTSITEDNWYVSWIGDKETGARREVAYDDNSAFVQFRLTIKMKQPVSRAADGEGETQVYYLPERVDVANDANHYWFENSDLYVKLKASDLPDGVLTGISEIVDDTDNGPAVYYNLQGVRVDNPTAGNIYIKVTRKGSEKILF